MHMSQKPARNRNSFQADALMISVFSNLDDWIVLIFWLLDAKLNFLGYLSWEAEGATSNLGFNATGSWALKGSSTWSDDG